MTDVVLRERAAYLPAADALVVADLHIGRDEASNVRFPLGERADLAERLDTLLGHFSPDRVVLAGDVLHSFRHATDHAARILEGLAHACRDAGAEPVLLTGNHDVHLEDVWQGKLSGELLLGDGDETPPVLVCHGHEVPALVARESDGGKPATDLDPDRDRDLDPNLVVCGHDHPVIDIEGTRHPCYLRGPGHGGLELLMLPAFNRLAPGVEVGGMRADDFDSPLVTDVDGLRPLVYDDSSQEILAFPPLGELRQLL